MLAVTAALLAALGAVAVAEPAIARPSRPAGPPMEPCPGGNWRVDPATGLNRCHIGGGGSTSPGRRGSPGTGGGGGDDDGGDGGGGDGGGGGGGGAPPPPTRPEIEAAVQRRVLVSASTYLRHPQVSFDDGRPEVGGGPGGSTPGLDVDAHVGIATFIEVTNWQGQQVDRYAQTDPFGQEWWIRITATPRLSFRPGEPGAPTVRCQGGGTRYDPDGPSAEEQAERPGACAYQYTMRTGVDGRPDAWPAEVVVDWTIVWEANFPLPANLPQSDQLVEPVPREVGEISSVVVED